eukprot:1196013-Prorocentrum_minimum.AAC.7
MQMVTPLQSVKASPQILLTFLFSPSVDHSRDVRTGGWSRAIASDRRCVARWAPILLSMRRHHQGLRHTQRGPGA